MSRKSKPSEYDDPPDYDPSELMSDLLPNASFTTVKDDSAYKSWICLYPVYFDSTKSVKQGRKIVKDLSVPHPLAKDLAESIKALQLSLFFEPHKRHPRDWENPGRLRVQLKMEDNTLVDPTIKTRKELMKRVAKLLRTIQQNPQEYPPKHSPAAPSGLLRESGGSSSVASSSSSAASGSAASASASTPVIRSGSSKKKGRKGRR
ncbi:5860_t:CDS:2 [Paraglomus occultum]|uniref:5860_t:CDS:1 n=1 Tax=Paraglomus occultum TaxID=144539 RepID=A0A9N9B5X0_9GLOM|nr:5860_t:CDS:2 [Paraglomus occultum]